MALTKNSAHCNKISQELSLKERLTGEKCKDGRRIKKRERCIVQIKSREFICVHCAQRHLPEGDMNSEHARTSFSLLPSPPLTLLTPLLFNHSSVPLSRFYPLPPPPPHSPPAIYEKFPETHCLNSYRKKCDFM